MKKLILLGLAIVLFSACQPSQPERYSTTGPEIDMIKSLVNNYHNGDWENWVKKYADTAKIYYNNWENYVSAKEAMDGHKETIDLLSSYKFEDEPIFYEKIIDDNGKIWINFWGNWKGTLKANDKSLEVPVHLSIQLADNKIVEEYGFWDNAPMMAALNEVEAANSQTE